MHSMRRPQPEKHLLLRATTAKVAIAIVPKFECQSLKISNRERERVAIAIEL